MTIRSETRKIERTAADRARLKAIRESIQKAKPTLADLAAKGEVIVPLGSYLAVRQFLAELRQARQEKKLTLEQVAAKAGMDKAVLSRLETGKQPNPTVDSLFRVAAALGKTVGLRLEDGAGPPRRARKAPA